MNKIQKYTKTFLVSILTIAIMTASFKAVTQTALGMKIGEEEIITTNYLLSLSASNLQNNTKSQESYIKPDYKIVDNNKPTSSEISREEAAEIGVQSLYSIFGLDMNDKVIEMAYGPTEYGRRPRWEGNFWVDGKRESFKSIVESYSFYIDSISGELASLEHIRVLEKDTEDEFNLSIEQRSIEQNAEEYESLAKELSIKAGAIQGAVKTAKYEGQGVTKNGEYYVSIRVTGENGDETILKISRYDKELTAVSYNIDVKEIDSFRNLK